MLTKLAAWRVKRGVTQKEMAEATGIPLSTYWRLERGRVWSPPVRYLTNCAIALGCELDDLIEGDVHEWYRITRSTPDDPPDPEVFWRQPNE